MTSKYTIVLAALCFLLAQHVAMQQERWSLEWNIAIAIGAYAIQPFVHPVIGWILKMLKKRTIKTMDKYTLLAQKTEEKA